MNPEIWNYHEWITETDSDKLEALFTKLLEDSGFIIVNYIEHFFQPQGFSAVWLLQESHLALHTWPDYGKTYFELSSCNKEKYELFHGVRITDDALTSAVDLSSKYITSRYLPDKAIDLIDEAASFIVTGKQIGRAHV